MKRFLVGALTVATLTLPVAALAANYQYVNTQGNLETETAANASQALTQPTDKAPHSGVMLLTGVVTSSTPSSAAGTYMDQLPGINTQARTMYLTLLPSGSVILSSTYNNQTTPIMIESGTWTTAGTNQVQVTLTGNGMETYSPAQVLIFTYNGSTLVATSYDSSIYGASGLTFTR
jgi:hypothetical protein